MKNNFDATNFNGYGDVGLCQEGKSRKYFAVQKLNEALASKTDKKSKAKTVEYRNEWSGFKDHFNACPHCHKVDESNMKTQ